MEISQRAKDIVDKGYMVQPKGDLALQVSAYQKQKQDAAFANNPYYKPEEPYRVALDRVANINTSLNSQGYSTSVNNVPTTITSANLSNSQSPYKLPETTQNTVQTTGASVQGLTEGLNTGIQGMISAEDKKIADYQTQVQTQQKTTQSLIDKLMGKGQAQVQAETTAGIPEKTQALTDITNEYNTKALEYRRMEEAVMKEGTLTDVQKSARLREISRVKNTELADIGIKQAVAQNNLSAAQQLVDRKIDLEYGDLKDIIKIQTDFLNNNKEDLDTAYKNALNLKITENTRKYEEGKSIGEFAKTVAANGADAGTISRVSSAKTMAEAIQAAGQFAGKATSMDGSGGGGSADASVEYYSQLLAEGKITLSNVPQSVRNAVVANSQGIINKPLSDTALTKINDTNFAISSLNDLRAKIQTNLGQLGPVTGLEALNPYSEKRKLQADIDRVRQTVGKALEGGVLRKEDEEKYKKILATITDTPETALYKIDALISSIQRNIEDYKSLQSESGRFVPTKTGTVAPEDLRAKYNY